VPGGIVADRGVAPQATGSMHLIPSGDVLSCLINRPRLSVTFTAGAVFDAAERIGSYPCATGRSSRWLALGQIQVALLVLQECRTASLEA